MSIQITEEVLSDLIDLAQFSLNKLTGEPAMDANDTISAASKLLPQPLVLSKETLLTWGMLKEWLDGRGVQEDSLMLNVVDVNYHPEPNMVTFKIGDNQ